MSITSILKILDKDGSSSRVKHVDIALQFLKGRKDIKYRYVQTQDNVADIFTKALASNKFNQFRSNLVKDTTWILLRSYILYLV